MGGGRQGGYVVLPLICHPREAKSMLCILRRFLLQVVLDPSYELRMPSPFFTFSIHVSLKPVTALCCSVGLRVLPVKVSSTPLNTCFRKAHHTRKPIIDDGLSSSLLLSICLSQLMGQWVWPFIAKIVDGTNHRPDPTRTRKEYHDTISRFKISTLVQAVPSHHQESVIH